MPASFTATQIARALGRTVRGVRKALRGVEAVGKALVKGKKAAAWGLEQLPPIVFEEINRRANLNGYQNAEGYVSSAPDPWVPSIQGSRVALADLASHCLKDAKKLQGALIQPLHLLAEAKLLRKEIEAIGMGEYRTVFGRQISAGHWWRLINRTLRRNNGVGDFNRIEIFLADKLARKKVQPFGGFDAVRLDILQRWLLEVKNLENPTVQEATMVWDAAFQEVEAMVEVSLPRFKAYRIVLKALQSSGIALAKNPIALRRNFDRKFGKWLNSGKKPSAITDSRREKSGYYRSPALSQDDRKTLIARAVENGGRIAQGWRAAIFRSELSFETTQRFIHNPADKSYVPRSIREEITQDVRLLRDIHHGPRTARLKGAYITRDYSDCAAGDWFQGDDTTLNHYYWENTPAGILSMRGQCLVFVDVRTNYILGFALHSERNYNARIIRECITRIHDTYGLPRQGFYFEKGIWKSARILTGDQRGDELPFAVTEAGLREFVRFRHAQTPRAKVVERIIGILQNETEALPGYVGRNEVTDRYERIQEKLQEARCGKIPYQSFLLSKEQWVRQLELVCEKYNEEAQSGKLKGLSPREAWEQFFSTPLVRLPTHLRFLLANHRKPLRVTRNGIRLSFKGQSCYYRNEATGRMREQDVLVWYQTEDEVPDSITITDLSRANPVEVPREIQPLSMDASEDVLGKAKSQIDAHNAYAKTLYRTIQPRFTQHKMFREVLADEETAKLGVNIARERMKVSAGRRQKITAIRKIHDHEKARGLAPSRTSRDPEVKLHGFELLKQADEIESTIRQKERS